MLQPKGVNIMMLTFYQHLNREPQLTISPLETKANNCWPGFKLIFSGFRGCRMQSSWLLVFQNGICTNGLKVRFKRVVESERTVGWQEREGCALKVRAGMLRGGMTTLTSDPPPTSNPPTPSPDNPTGESGRRPHPWWENGNVFQEVFCRVQKT